MQLQRLSSTLTARRDRNCETNVTQLWSEGSEMRMIGYERVSTARQGASGLGIEAQRQGIDGFVAQRAGTLLARFTEVESGRNPDTSGAEAGAPPREGHWGHAG